MKTKFFALALTVLLVPTFLRMLKPGIYSMADFPYFRVVEYAKCVSDWQIPCRWSPDAGLGYGEPVFNFYAPLPFFAGGVLTQTGLSSLNVLKFLFAFSLLASGVAMFFLSKKIWKNSWAGFLSGILYVYAPYRAVDVWVRGALAESLAFVLFPLILLCFENYLEKKTTKWLMLFTLTLAGLILTHNLSVLIFAPVLIVWVAIRLVQEKSFNLLPHLFLSATGAFLLSSFYLLPAIFESQYVNLASTTVGYFDFRAHFVTIPQLFFQRYWGYGGSTWGSEDGLSLAIGQVQWIAAILAGLGALMTWGKEKRWSKNVVCVLALLLLAFFLLFLTHNKSAFLWEPFANILKYIQFPWRFLGIALFCISLASGFALKIFKGYEKYIAISIAVIAVVLNIGFFKEDLWFPLTDGDMQTGERWVEQKRASIGDYWPSYGLIPSDPAPLQPEGGTLIAKTSNSYAYAFEETSSIQVVFPIAYFPGWKTGVDGKFGEATYNDKGLIISDIPIGKHTISLVFSNTLVRTIGNIISIITALGILILGYAYKK